MNRVEELELEIKKHDKLYWEDGKPEISDPDYDLLVEELRGLDPLNPLINRINTPKTKSKTKIKHKIPMLSLDKVYSVEELINWASKVKRDNNEKFLVETKFDGWSIEYEDKLLSTRGDGYEGDLISNKIPYIRHVNGKSLDDVDDYIHGEVVMLESTFKLCKDRLLRESGEQYKTARTILTGLLSKDDIRDDCDGVLTLVPFDWNSIVVKFCDLKNLNWGVLIDEVKNGDFPADGLVLKLADQEYGKTLGKTSHHFKYAMALKFANPTGKTVLRDIFWSMGKQKITPVAIVDPVKISGVIVDSPNLHNYKYILDNDVHIGDTLIIERCGDVIPDLKRVIPGENRTEIKLDICPYCGSSVVYIEPELICENYNCPAKHLKQLMDSVVRIGIERLGEPTLLKLIKIGCRNLVDIFNLTKEDIIKLERFAESSTENLYNEIQKVKKSGVYEWQILASLNIPGIGRSLSREVLNKFSLKELMECRYDELLCIDKIGEERAKEICYGLATNEEYINKLLKILPIKQNKVEINNNRTICFTGKMPEKRKYYENLAKKNGYNPVGSVSKDLSLLVIDSLDNTHNKVKAAIKHGVAIVVLEDFLSSIDI